MCRRNSKCSKKHILVWKLRRRVIPSLRKIYTICTERGKQPNRNIKSNSGNKMQGRICIKVMKGQGKTLKSGRNRNSLPMIKLSTMSSSRTDIRKTSINILQHNTNNKLLSKLLKTRTSSVQLSALSHILTKQRTIRKNRSSRRIQMEHTMHSSTTRNSWPSSRLVLSEGEL